MLLIDVVLMSIAAAAANPVAETVQCQVFVIHYGPIRLYGSPGNRVVGYLTNYQTVTRLGRGESMSHVRVSDDLSGWMLSSELQCDDD